MAPSSSVRQRPTDSRCATKPARSLARSMRLTPRTALAMRTSTISRKRSVSTEAEAPGVSSTAAAWASLPYKLAIARAWDGADASQRPPDARDHRRLDLHLVEFRLERQALTATNRNAAGDLRDAGVSRCRSGEPRTRAKCSTRILVRDIKSPMAAVPPNWRHLCVVGSRQGKQVSRSTLSPSPSDGRRFHSEAAERCIDDPAETEPAWHAGYA